MSFPQPPQPPRHQPGPWQAPPQWGPPRQQWGAPQQQWQPHQWPPRLTPPPKRSNGLGWFLFLLFAVGAGIFVFAALTRGAGPIDPPLPPHSEPPTAAATAEAQPKEPEREESGLPEIGWPELLPPDSTDPDWATLQQSVLYDAPIPALTGCPPPERARGMADLERIGAGQMECIQRAWQPVLAELGLPAHEVPVYYYDGDTVETQCGRVSAPALYCSFGGGTIYIGESTLNGAQWHDFAVKDMTGHEYTHHLQAIAGMFEAEYRVNQGNEGIRRSELQATCGGYAMIAHDDSFEMDRRTFDTFEPFLRSVIEDGIHGSKDSVAYWGLRGLYSENLGNCNTWTAASEDVD